MNERPAGCTCPLPWKEAQCPVHGAETRALIRDLFGEAALTDTADLPTFDFRLVTETER